MFIQRKMHIIRKGANSLWNVSNMDNLVAAEATRMLHSQKKLCRKLSNGVIKQGKSSESSWEVVNTFRREMIGPANKR